MCRIGGRTLRQGLTLASFTLVALSSALSVHAQDVLLRPSWTGTLTLGPRWETNVSLLPGDTSADIAGRATGTLTRHFAWRRVRVDLTGDASGVVYRESTEYNRLGGGLVLSGTFRLTRQATLNLSQTYRSDYARELPQASGSPTIVPAQVETRTLVSSANLTRIISRATTFIASASANLVEFPESADLPESPLESGDTFLVRTSLTRRGDGGRMMAGSAQYQAMRAGGSVGHTLELTGMFGQRIYRQWGAEFDLGAAVLRPIGVEEILWRPVGTFKIDGRLRRHTLALSYGTSVAQAYGFARTDLLHNIAVSEDARLSRHVTLAIRLQTSLSRAADRAGGSYDSSTGSVQLGWAVRRRMRVTATYLVQRLSYGDAASSYNHSIALGVNASRTWR